jgi:hypothetical protein
VKNQIKIACALAEMEQNFKLGFVKQAFYICDTVTQVNDLHKIPCTNSLLKALAQEKVALSLSDFIQLTNKCERTKADNLASKIQPYLPGTFTRMCLDSEKLAEDIANNPFSISATIPSDESVEFAYKQCSGASLKLDKMQKRAWAQSINGQTQKVNLNANVVMCPPEEYAGIANAYGLYKLAFLNELANFDEDLELTTNIVLRQNYNS